MEYECLLGGQIDRCCGTHGCPQSRESHKRAFLGRLFKQNDLKNGTSLITTKSGNELLRSTANNILKDADKRESGKVEDREDNASGDL
jgi:hypothetical protein